MLLSSSVAFSRKRLPWNYFQFPKHLIIFITFLRRIIEIFFFFFRSFPLQLFHRRGILTIRKFYPTWEFRCSANSVANFQSIVACPLKKIIIISWECFKIFNIIEYIFTWICSYTSPVNSAKDVLTQIHIAGFAYKLDSFDGGIKYLFSGMVWSVSFTLQI